MDFIQVALSWVWNKHCMRTMMHTQGKLIHVCCKRGLVVYCCVAHGPTTLFVSIIDKQAWKGHN